MKRFFVICLCLSLLSLLIIPAFAASLSDDTSYPCEFVFNDSLFNNLYSSSLDFSCDGVSYSSIEYESPEVTGTFYTSSSSVEVYSDGWVDPKYKTITINSAPSSAVMAWLNSNGSVSVPDVTTSEDTTSVTPSTPGGVDVGSGVSSFISWTGFAIRDIINSPFILPLIGLSVALFLALPWGISKIKSLIKGY